MVIARPNDFAQQIADMQRRLGNLERTSILKSASIGSGGLKIRDGGSITVQEPGDLILQAADGTEDWKASTDALRTDYAWVNVAPITMSTSWTLMATADVTVPKGFHGLGNYIVAVDCGTALTAGSNLSVQAAARGLHPDGYHPWSFGPSSNSGSQYTTGSTGVATAFWASNFVGSDGLTAIQFGVFAILSGAQQSPGTDGGVDIAASIIFRRG